MISLSTATHRRHRLMEIWRRDIDAPLTAIKPSPSQAAEYEARARRMARLFNKLGDVIRCHQWTQL